MELELLERRHSVRDYSFMEVSGDIINKLRSELRMSETHEAGLWFFVRTDDPDPFRGFMRSYGFFRNARNYVACVVDTSYPYTIERAGYFAEQFVIRATELGLGTCFVGGTYSAGHVNVPLRAGQRLLMLILFGYEAEKKRALMGALTGIVKGKRKEPEFFFNGSHEDYVKACSEFPWLERGLRGVACAPSWQNGRPVRFSVKREESASAYVVAEVDSSREHRLIDLGIAKFNFAAAAGGDWEWGNGAAFYPTEPQRQPR